MADFPWESINKPEPKKVIIIVAFAGQNCMLYICEYVKTNTCIKQDQQEKHEHYHYLQFPHYLLFYLFVYGYNFNL